MNKILHYILHGGIIINTSPLIAQSHNGILIANEIAPAPASLDKKSIAYHIEQYNKRLCDAYFEDLSKQKTAPTIGHIAYRMLPYLPPWITSYHKERQVREMAVTTTCPSYDMYIKGQLKLIEQLADSFSDSSQNPSNLNQKILGQQAHLETQYPQASQKLSNAIAMVFAEWEKQISIEALIRQQNNEKHQRKLDEQAKNENRLRFHQLPPEMQEFCLQYLYAVLESEGKYETLGQTKTITLLEILQEEKRILSTLDSKQLPENYQKELKNYISELSQFIADLENSADAQSLKRIDQSLRQYKMQLKHLKPIACRADILSNILEHFELGDYYRALFWQKSRKQSFIFYKNLDQAIKHKAGI